MLHAAIFEEIPLDFIFKLQSNLLLQSLSDG